MPPLRLAQRMSEIAGDSDRLALATEAIQLADVKLFVRFRPIRQGKRSLNKVAGGVVTIGAAPPPINLYQGPTARKSIKKTSPGAANAAPGRIGRRSADRSDRLGSGREGTSLGNVNRGDRI
jgi:hypothetical protein